MLFFKLNFLSRAEQSRAEQSRAEQSRAEQSRAEQSRRIEWIDIAKGIGILLVIIDHTVQFGSLTRNIIFSFHMPMFFILSGYTFKPATDLKTLLRHLCNNFLRLILPCLYVSVFVLAYIVIKSNDYDILAIKLQTYKMLKSLFYASGVEFRGQAAGMVWFIFSLFWAKTIMDCIYVFQKNDYKYCTVGCLTFLGICLGATHNWQFQNFDVTFVALAFVYIGMLWRSNNVLINKYTKELFAIALIIWSLLISQGMYIEMASRHYPYYSICIFEAILASFAYCVFCKSLLDYNYAKKILMLFGSDSIIIFYLHHCDWMIGNLWLVEGKTLRTILLRVFIVFVAYTLVIVLRRIKERFFIQ